MSAGASLLVAYAVCSLVVLGAALAILASAEGDGRDKRDDRAPDARPGRDVPPE